MAYKPGDVVLLQKLDSGQIRLGVVDDITKGGRKVCLWIGNTKGRGDFLVKPRVLNPSEDRIVRKAKPHEAKQFHQAARPLLDLPKDMP